MAKLLPASDDKPVAKRKKDKPVPMVVCIGKRLFIVV